MSNVKTADLTGGGWITFEEIDEDTYANELENLLSRLSLYKVEETDFENDRPSKMCTFDFKISGSASDLKIDFIGKPSYPLVTRVAQRKDSVRIFDQGKSISTSYAEAAGDEILDQDENILCIENSVIKQDGESGSGRTIPKITSKSRIPRAVRRTKFIRPKFNLRHGRKSRTTKKSNGHFCQISGDNDLLDPYKKLSHLRFQAFEKFSHFTESGDGSNNDRSKNLEKSTFWRIFGVRPATLKPDGSTVSSNFQVSSSTVRQNLSSVFGRSSSCVPNIPSSHDHCRVSFFVNPTKTQNYDHNLFSKLDDFSPNYTKQMMKPDARSKTIISHPIPKFDHLKSTYSSWRPSK